MYRNFFTDSIESSFKDSNFTGDYLHEDGTKFSLNNGLINYIEYSNGTKQWFKNGLVHRENGPAVEWENGNKEWWIEQASNL